MGAFNTTLQTVIIPTYNRRDMLVDAVNSVLNQSQKGLEVFIIDDCSTDGTEEFARSIKDSRVHYFKNDNNSGPEFSRSFGLRHARGKYITFLDDDDYYTDYDFFTKAIKIFEEHDTTSAPIAFVAANVEIFKAETGKKNRYYDIGTPGRVKGVDYILKRKKPSSTFPTVFKADILHRAGLDNMMIFDTETYWHAALFGDAWFMSDYIGVRRLHKESITFGYKHNLGQESRYYAKITEMRRRSKLIRDSIYCKTDKKQVQSWYIARLLRIIGYADYSMNTQTRNKIAFQVLMKSGFMPRLWLNFIPYYFRMALRRIEPLRKVYRFIKYRGKVPD